MPKIRIFPVLLSACLGAALSGSPSKAAPAPEMPLLDCGWSGTDFQVQWPSVSGQLYQIQRSPSLLEAAWQPVGDALPGTDAVMSYSEPWNGTAMFFRVQVSLPLPAVSRIAFLGDSITAQNSQNLIYRSAAGYFTWAQAFGGSRWNPVRDDTTVQFATLGKRAFELSAEHLSKVIASDAQACVLAYGTNDATQASTTASVINQAVSDWAALRAAGIVPVAVTVLPMGSVGGGFGGHQARVAEINTALRAAAAEHDVALCDWTTVLEAVPGSNNGIALDSYFLNNDNIHPNQLACSRMGRALNATLAAHFNLNYDVWANAAWITPNVELAGSAGQPSNSWNLYSPAGTVNAKTLVPSPEGNWWEFDISPGSSTGSFNVLSAATNTGGAPGGKKVEAVAEIQVMEGALDSAQLHLLTAGNPLAISMHGAARSGQQVLPADGIVVLRTPVATLSAAVSHVYPSLYFSSAESRAVVRIRRCGVRVVE